MSSKDTLEVGKKLVDLCKAGKGRQAIDELYAPNIVSIEATDMGQIPRRMEGIQAVRGKTDWWEGNHKVHSGEAMGPYPQDDRFIVHFKYDVTATGGKMAGQRTQLDEAALYTVKDGKIVQEEFFYAM